MSPALPRSYRLLRRLVRLLLGAFFRRIEISGLENVPKNGGGLIVAWHPNALIDPALIFVSFPGTIVFGARHGLFSWPVIGRIVRAIGTVPIYRAEDLPDPEDDQARRTANDRSIGAMADAIADGAFTALFPEGTSHDDPGPRSLKSGAARIFLQAYSTANAPKPVILPVGLHYDDKNLMGSNALIVYHPPLELPPTITDMLALPRDDEMLRQRSQAATLEIEQSLKNVTYATENWRIHQLLHRARKLIRAERSARAGSVLPPPTMTERVLAFQRLWTGYNMLKDRHPERVRQLLHRIERYDSELAGLGIEDHELDQLSDAGSRRIGWGLIARSVLAFVIFPPLLIAGYLVNLPPAGIVWLISRWRSKLDKDVATIKILAGAGAFPLAWSLTAVWTVSALAPDTAWIRLSLALLAFLGAALSGVLILNYQRFAVQTLRALRLRSTSADNLAALRELRRVRSELCDAVVELAAGLDLPGTVLPDGRVLDENAF